MPTNWTLPNSIIQYAETGAEDRHVSWLEIDNFSALKSLDQRSIKTRRDLVHIARDPRHDIIEKTYYLSLTGFRFNNLPINLSGIELKLSMNRFGRITDDEILLCLNGESIGENQATLDLNPTKIYGDQTSLWNTNLSISDVQNPSFGCIIRFQSHPKWPHRSTALIDAIEIRIH